MWRVETARVLKRENSTPVHTSRSSTVSGSDIGSYHNSSVNIHHGQSVVHQHSTQHLLHHRHQLHHIQGASSLELTQQQQQQHQQAQQQQQQQQQQQSQSSTPSLHRSQISSLHHQRSLGSLATSYGQNVPAFYAGRFAPQSSRPVALHAVQHTPYSSHHSQQQQQLQQQAPHSAPPIPHNSHQQTTPYFGQLSFSNLPQQQQQQQPQQQQPPLLLSQPPPPTHPQQLMMGGATKHSTLSLDSAGLAVTGGHRLLPAQPQRQQPTPPQHLKRNKSCYAHYYRYRSSIRQTQPPPQSQSHQQPLPPSHVALQQPEECTATELHAPYHQPLFYRASSPVFDRGYPPPEYGGRRPSIREQLGLARSFEDLPVNSGPRHYPNQQNLQNFQNPHHPRLLPHQLIHQQHQQQQQQQPPPQVALQQPRRSASSSSSSDDISSPRHIPRQVLISYRNPFDDVEILDDEDAVHHKRNVKQFDATGHLTFDPSCVRTVLLHKFASDKSVPNRRSGGITLCGGLEVGLTSVYISRVAPNSASAKCGLAPGDEILSADYESFLDGTITCKRAYDILERDREVIVLSILPRRDAFNAARLRHLTFDWLDPRGRPVSPPTPPDTVTTASTISATTPSVEDSEDSQNRSSPTSFFTGLRVRAPKLRDLPRAAAAAAQHRLVSKLNNHFSFFKGRKSPTQVVDTLPHTQTNVRQIVIHLEQGIDLGLGIRGGIEYGLGIYITRVEPDSLADKAGLQVGDQILTVNRCDFSEVLHDEAVDILRSAARLSIKVRYAGKVPACQQVTSGAPIHWSPRHSPNHRYQPTPTSTSTSSGLGPELSSYRTPPAAVTPTAVGPPGSPRNRHSPSSLQQSHRMASLKNAHTPPPPPLTSSVSQPCPNLVQPVNGVGVVSQVVSGSVVSQQPPPLLRHFRSESHSNSRASMHDRDTPTLLITDDERLPCDDDDEAEESDSMGGYFGTHRQLKHLQLMRYQKGLPNSRSEEEEQILDEECLKFLNEKERISFAYYRNEYETKALDIDSFVESLVDLLNNEQKYSIMFHLYHSIKPDDLIRFQELIYAKRPHSGVNNGMVGIPTVSSGVGGSSSHHTSPHHLPSQSSPHSRNKIVPPGQRTESSESSSFDFLSATTCDDSAIGGPSNVGGGNFIDTRMHPTRLNAIPLDTRRFSTQFQQDQCLIGNNRLSRSECIMATQNHASGLVGGGPNQKTNVPMPNPVAYRKQFMTRRHSSGTSETSMAERQSREYQQAHQYPDPNQLHHFGAILGPNAVPVDDRRWSFNVAAGNRRPSNVFNATDLRTTSPCPEPSTPPPSSTLLSAPLSQSRKGSHVSVCLTPAGPELITEVTPPSGGTSPSHLTVDGPPGSGGGGGGCVSPSHQQRRNSGNHLIVPDMSGPGNVGPTSSDTEDESFEFPAHLRVRRHRSLPSPTSYTSADVQFASVPPPSKAHQRSASFRLPNHKAITQPNGRWRVKVKKTKSFLGIAIEGGLNVTTQTQPRIISIHNDGAAVFAEDLKVGHIIMEVDGQTTASMNHQQVAAMISRAYYNTPHKDYVEFYVREKSRAEFDIRRSSFMLLNNSFE